MEGNGVSGGTFAKRENGTKNTKAKILQKGDKGNWVLLSKEEKEIDKTILVREREKSDRPDLKSTQGTKEKKALSTRTSPIATKFTITRQGGKGLTGCSTCKRPRGSLHVRESY